MAKTKLVMVWLVGMALIGVTVSEVSAEYVLQKRLPNFYVDGVDIRAWGVNDAGMVVGQQDFPGNGHPQGFVTNASTGEVEPLPLAFGAFKSPAYSINNSIDDANDVQIVGYMPTGGGLFQWHEFIWQYFPFPIDLWTNTTDLGTVPGGSSAASARSVNDLRQVAGLDANDVAGADAAASLYLPSAAYGLPAGMNSLGTLCSTGAARASGESINEHGEIVGYSQDCGGTFRAFIWLPTAKYGQPAGMSQLGLSNEAWAVAINDSGQVATYRLVSGIFESVLWQNGSKTLLPKLAGGTNMTARDINNSGVIVGSIDNMPSGRAGFVWDSVNGTQLVSDLETAGWTNYEFQGISDTGFICGYGTDPNSVKAAFLLAKVPECGDQGFHAGDLTKDCYVNFLDFGEFAKDWLKCSDPNDPINCDLDL